jgi:hypothetical protein
MDFSSDTVLIAVFGAVLLVVFTILNMFFRGRDVSRNIASVQASRRSIDSQEINDILGSETDYIQYYFEVQNSDAADSLRNRLIRAGYFNRSA